MFRFIKSQQVGVQALIPILGIILFVPALFFINELPVHHVHTGEGWTYTLWKSIVGWPQIWQVILTMIVAMMTIILLTSIDQSFHVLEKRSFILAWIFLFLITSPGQFFRFHPAYLAAFFILLGYLFSLKLYSSSRPNTILFNLAFCFSLAFLLYPPLIWLVPVLILCVGLMTSPTPGQWTIVIIGVITPVLITAITAILLQESRYMFQDLFRWFEFRSTWPPPIFNVKPLFWAWLVVLLFWVLLATLRFRSQKNLSRQFYLVLFVQFLICGLIVLGMETVSTEMFWVMMIPLGFLYANWIQSLRTGWWRDLFVLFLLGFWIYFTIESF